MDSSILAQTIAQLQQLVTDAKNLELEHQERLNRVHPKWRDSAANLLHYRALRRHDIRQLQITLSKLGMSRLAKAEAHILPSVEATIAILQNFLQANPLDLQSIPSEKIELGGTLLKEHSEALLGKTPPNRNVSIMVTQPTEAAHSQEIADKMLAAGLDCARINCAHDTPHDWKTMVQFIKASGHQRGKEVKICMDLAGPKIRTGAVQPGPHVVRFKAQKNEKGEVVMPARFYLQPETTPPAPESVPVPESFLQELREGTTLKLRDARQKKRVLYVEAVEEQKVTVVCHKTVYLETGTRLSLKKKKTEIVGTIGALPAVEMPLVLQTGDVLLLTKSNAPGMPAEYDDAGDLIRPAFISCTAPHVFYDLKAGETVLFDDGKIAGIIQSVSIEEVNVRITHTPPNGGKLRADKGINFPQSNLKISGLTPKDITDLDFVAEYADVVNLSFVNRASDVERLREELARCNATEKVGIILKIETVTGYNQLTDILLTAMQHYPLGVMIARGDLAIEAGWQNLGRMQEEILSLCHAAHIPLVWATQVLETLAKKGIPSRAELTDATMAQRTECVMLNKGPNIVEAIGMLANILVDMASYQNKKAAMLPPMAKANG